MRKLLSLTVAVIAFAGCGLDPDAGGDPAGLQSGCKDAQPRSQSVSQPCCLEWGIDACGAGLFCAAFDGRVQPTCYLERSRTDGQACTEDRQCTSGSCNAAVGKCRSAPFTQCDAAVGCAKDASGQRFACDVGQSPSKCSRVGDGKGGSVCEGSADCASGSCVAARCKAGFGDKCAAQSDCASGTCKDCYASGVECTVRSDGKECLQSCGGDPSYPQYSACNVALGGVCKSSGECQDPQAQCEYCYGGNCKIPADSMECLKYCPITGKMQYQACR